MPKSKCQPPFNLASGIMPLVAGIAEQIGRLSAQSDFDKDLHLRRINRIRTIAGSLTTIRYRGPKNGGLWEVQLTDTGKHEK